MSRYPRLTYVERVLPSLAGAVNGPIDVLVNNAGVMPNDDFLALGLALGRMTVEVNVFGVIHGMRAVLPSAVDTALASGLEMRPIPKVKPEAIASAVLDSCGHRRGEVAVPGYVGLLAVLAAVTPTLVLDRVRRLMRNDRALAADSSERTAYREGLRAQERFRT